MVVAVVDDMHGDDVPARGAPAPAALVSQVLVQDVQERGGGGSQRQAERVPLPLVLRVRGELGTRRPRLPLDHLETLDALVDHEDGEA